MIQLVMKPEKAPVVNHEGLYSVRMNGAHLMHIRARNAPHAERKLAYCFKRELSGKTLDFNLEELENGEGKDGAEEPCQAPGPSEVSEDHQGAPDGVQVGAEPDRLLAVSRPEAGGPRAGDPGRVADGGAGAHDRVPRAPEHLARQRKEKET